MTTQPQLRVVADGQVPPPLLPPDIDLGDMPEVMLNIQWLCDSRWAITASAEEQIAAVRLHARSQHEKPAATLPADDVELAFLAGYGRDLPGWRRVKDRALEGWTLCSDGRYYRREMAIKALNTWIKLLADRRKQASGVAKRKKIEFNPEPYDRPISTAIDALYALDPHARILRNYMNVEPDVTPAAAIGADPDNLPNNVPDNYKGKEPKGTESSEYISPTGLSPVGAPGRPKRDSTTGGTNSAPAEPQPEVPPWPPDAFERFWDGYDRKVDKQAAREAFNKVLEERPMPFDQFMRAVLRYFEHKPTCNDTAYPATWLHKRRWEDVYPDAPLKPPPRGGPPRSHKTPWRPTSYHGR